MQDLTPQRFELEPIEIAPRRGDPRPAAAPAEMVAAPRLRQRAPLPAGFDARGVKPDDLRSLADLARFPLHHQSGICAPTTPSACSPCRRSSIARIHASSGTTGKPTVVGYTQARSRDLGAGRRPLACGPPAARPGMKLHNAYGYGLFTGGLGYTTAAERLRHDGHPGLGRHDRAAGAADPRFQAGHHHGDALLHAGDPRRVPPPGPRSPRRPRSRSASSAPSPGPTPCAPRSRRPSTCTPSTSTASPR